MTNNEEPRKRGKYTTKKSQELKDLLTAAKEFQFKEEKQKVSFKRNPTSIAEFTKNVCLYPGRFLDNDNTCVTCDIYEHCACSVKSLGKKKRHE